MPSISLPRCGRRAAIILSQITAVDGLRSKVSSVCGSARIATQCGVFTTVVVGGGGGG